MAKNKPANETKAKAEKKEQETTYDFSEALAAVTPKHREEGLSVDVEAEKKEPSKEPDPPVVDEGEKAKDEQPVVQPPAGSKLASAVVKNLTILRDYGPHLSVREFREMAKLGREAVSLLEMYKAQGLVESCWSSSAERYSITDEGKKVLDE